MSWWCGGSSLIDVAVLATFQEYQAGNPVHQDTINESGFVDDSIAAMKGSLPTEQVAAETDMSGWAFRRCRMMQTSCQNHSSLTHSSCSVSVCSQGRTIHTYHTEGAGGGHAPDIIKVSPEHLLLVFASFHFLPLQILTHWLLGCVGLWSSKCIAFFYKSNTPFHDEYHGGRRRDNVEICWDMAKVRQDSRSFVVIVKL